MRILAPISSVALIHVHYVAWQYLPGPPSSAAPIDLHNLAWHHLVLTCSWHHCPPKRPNRSFYEASGCAAANFSREICSDKIHWQLHYFCARSFVEGGMVVMVVRGLRVIGVGRNRMRSKAQRSKFAIKETLLIQSAKPIERSEAPCASCLSAPLHVHSRYADLGPTSSVALIHFHYVAWHYRNARPGLAFLYFWHHCPP